MEMIVIERVSQAENALSGKSRRLAKFATSRSTVDHDRFCAPDQTKLPKTAVESFALGSGSEVDWRDAVIIEDHTRLAAR